MKILEWHEGEKITLFIYATDIIYLHFQIYSLSQTIKMYAKWMDEL